MSDLNLNPARPKITVIFLIYNDAQYVPGLVDAIKKQQHPQIKDQSEWLEVIFMDNGSRDGTAQAIRTHLSKAGSPENYHLEINPQNMGISRALNKAFQMVRTPYALTCHCDVLFGREDYVAKMMDLLERNPQAGAITGQPSVARGTDGNSIPFAEKVNLIANLMDIFPVHTNEELVPVGFAESRCDGWRIAALQAVGYYDTTLRLAGEDQVMAARMRQAGYEIYQAPALNYFLSVSSDQDSLQKLVKHQRLFGRAHPYIILRNPEAASGVIGKRAGANRRARTLLRATQLLSTFAYAIALSGLVLGVPIWTWLSPLIGIFLIKTWLFFKHFVAVRLTPGEFVTFYIFQIPLDISYTIGLFQGLWAMARGSTSRPIS